MMSSKEIENRILLNFVQENFAELSEEVAKRVVIDQRECPTHGMTRHSTLGKVAVCVECVKERRFGSPKMQERYGKAKP